MQLSPSYPLAAIVKHYLILESEKDIHLHYRLFSDGNPGIVFHFKNPLLQYTDNHLKRSPQPTSFVYGQITHYNDLMSGGKLGMLVVVLQPYGIYSLLRMAAAELNNCVIKLSDLFGRPASDLEDRVLSAKTIPAIIQHVENFLLKRLARINDTTPLFNESLDLIYKHKGIISIEALLKEIPVTERQLERTFKSYIGLSPKKFADIIRFHYFLKQLQQHPAGQKVSDVVYDVGYYDQSHLNNYFKKITGITPLQYKQDRRLLAINFMQLPGPA